MNSVRTKLVAIRTSACIKIVVVNSELRAGSSKKACCARKDRGEMGGGERSRVKQVRVAESGLGRSRTRGLSDRTYASFALVWRRLSTAVEEQPRLASSHRH